MKQIIYWHYRVLYLAYCILTLQGHVSGRLSNWHYRVLYQADYRLTLRGLASSRLCTALQGLVSDRLHSDMTGSCIKQIFVIVLTLEGLVYQADYALALQGLESGRLYTLQGLESGRLYTLQGLALSRLCIDIVWTLQGLESGRLYTLQGLESGRLYTLQGLVSGRLYTLQGLVSGRLYTLQGLVSDRICIDIVWVKVSEGCFCGQCPYVEMMTRTWPTIRFPANIDGWADIFCSPRVAKTTSQTIACAACQTGVIFRCGETSASGADHSNHPAFFSFFFFSTFCFSSHRSFCTRFCICCT